MSTSQTAPKVLATSAFIKSPGVFPLAGGKGFFAAVQTNGRSRYLGKFSDPFSAQAAVLTFTQGVSPKQMTHTY